MKKPSDIKHVVWDGDNTIWDWMGYAVPAYEAMCKSISRLSRKSFKATAAAMKDFYTQAGTLEDEGLVQALHENGFFDGVEGFELDETILAAQSAFSTVRNDRLAVYPGIDDVIRAIDLHVNQIMITDAPGGQASARLRRSGLAPHISGVYAMPTAEIDDLPIGLKRHFDGEQSPEVHVLPNEKPHVDLEKIFGLTREQIAEQVAIIGDNDAKDMELARRYGCVGIHAAYGAADPSLGKRLDRFAPPRVASRNMQTETTGDSNGRIHTANSAVDIMNLLF